MTLSASHNPGGLALPALGPSTVIPSTVATAAAAAVVVLAATGSGDLLLVALLLGVAARDRWVGAVGILVAVAAAGRYGGASLAAVAGAQAVTGPGGWTGTPAAVASVWLAAAALALVVCSDATIEEAAMGSSGLQTSPVSGQARPPTWPARVAAGVVCASLVAGPQAVSLGRGTPLHFGAAFAGAALAVAVGRPLRIVVGRRAAIIAFTCALIAAALGWWG